MKRMNLLLVVCLLLSLTSIPSLAGTSSSSGVYPLEINSKVKPGHISYMDMYRPDGGFYGDIYYAPSQEEWDNYLAGVSEGKLIAPELVKEKVKKTCYKKDREQRNSGANRLGMVNSETGEVFCRK